MQPSRRAEFWSSGARVRQGANSTSFGSRRFRNLRRTNALGNRDLPKGLNCGMGNRLFRARSTIPKMLSATNPLSQSKLLPEPPLPLAASHGGIALAPLAPSRHCASTACAVHQKREPYQEGAHLPSRAANRTRLPVNFHQAPVGDEHLRAGRHRTQPACDLDLFRLRRLREPLLEGIDFFATLLPPLEFRLSFAKTQMTLSSIVPAMRAGPVFDQGKSHF